MTVGLSTHLTGMLRVVIGYVLQDNGFDCWVEGLSTSLSISLSDLVSIPDILSVWEGLYSSRPERLIGVELVRGGGGELDEGYKCLTGVK